MFYRGERVVLVWDGLSAHWSRAMRAWAAGQDWLTLERLPAYAPELNPVELLWSSLKKHGLANLAGDHLADVADATEQGIHRINTDPRLPQLLQPEPHFFHGPNRQPHRTRYGSIPDIFRRPRSPGDPHSETGLTDLFYALVKARASIPEELSDSARARAVKPGRRNASVHPAAKNPAKHHGVRPGGPTVYGTRRLSCWGGAEGGWAMSEEESPQRSARPRRRAMAAAVAVGLVTGAVGGMAAHLWWPGKDGGSQPSAAAPAGSRAETVRSAMLAQRRVGVDVRARELGAPDSFHGQARLDLVDADTAKAATHVAYDGGEGHPWYPPEVVLIGDRAAVTSHEAVTGPGSGSDGGYRSEPDATAAAEDDADIHAALETLSSTAPPECAPSRTVAPARSPAALRCASWPPTRPSAPSTALTRPPASAAPSASPWSSPRATCPRA